jgi:hypothetical protein
MTIFNIILTAFQRSCCCHIDRLGPLGTRGDIEISVNPYDAQGRIKKGDLRHQSVTARHKAPWQSGFDTWIATPPNGGSQ